MRHITILGAGLLIGTALAVIIPEGVHSLYSNGNKHSGHGHVKGMSLRFANKKYLSIQIRDIRLTYYINRFISNF